MGLFRVSRENQGEDRFFYPKVILFSVGGGIGVAGMASGRDWLVGIAIGVVGVGILLRFLGRRDNN
jgi:hypothetical protein